MQARLAVAGVELAHQVAQGLGLGAQLLAAGGHFFAAGGGLLGHLGDARMALETSSELLACWTVAVAISPILAAVASTPATIFFSDSSVSRLSWPLPGPGRRIP